uniref:Mucin-1 n=1 Tax=Spermophilus dauricus TaxID=99837 RepID=A0A8C9QPD3_SPEDA
MTPGIQSPFFLLLLLPVTVPPSTSSNHSSPSPVYVRVSFFSLSFYISNLKFNSSLENPRTNYYQELQRNISELTRICGGRTDSRLPGGYHQCQGSDVTVLSA